MAQGILNINICELLKAGSVYVQYFCKVDVHVVKTERCFFIRASILKPRGSNQAKIKHHQQDEFQSKLEKTVSRLTVASSRLTMSFINSLWYSLRTCETLVSTSACCSMYAC